MASADAAPTSAPVTLMQQASVLTAFLHQPVVVGVATAYPAPVGAAAFAAPAPGSDAPRLSTVGVRGRLDALDGAFNATLSHVASPALLGAAATGTSGPARVGVVRGAAVMFVGIPKQQ
jgi:hypothetical protein